MARTAGFRVLRHACVAAVAALLIGADGARADVVADVESRLRSHMPEIVRPTGIVFAEAGEGVGTTKVSGVRPSSADASSTTDASARVFYPHSYADPFVVQNDAQRIAVRAVRANASTARVAGDKLAYDRVWPSVDAIEIPRASGTEELLVLHDGDAPRVFAFEIVEMRGVADIILRDGAVIFVPSSRGEAQRGGFVPVVSGIEIARPWVVDASGRRSETAASWSIVGRMLRLTVNADGLAFPLIVDPTFSAAPGLNTARANHTVTLLQNGKVLVAGGFDGTNVLQSAELYDPLSGSKTPLTMNVARYYHSATLLRNGKVLLAGGIPNGSSVTNTAELFDPANNTFTLISTISGAAGNLVGARYGHSATLLNNGKVLIAGGGSSPYGDAPVDTMESFDPATNAFSAIATHLSTQRAINAATLLPNGKVLISGGFNGGASNSADVYDPVANTIATFTMNEYRIAHTATLLPNGKVLIAGGSNAFAPLNSAELFDAVTNTFTPVATTMASSRERHRATLLTDGKVLLTGGSSFGAVNTAEVFDPAGGTNGTFTAVSQMSTQRQSHGAVMLPSGSVLVVGGALDDGTPTAKIDSYDGSVGSLNAISNPPPPRKGATATLLPNGTVLIAGGTPGAGPILDTAWLFDPSTLGYVAAGNMTTRRSGHTATLLTTGKVLVTGGTTEGGASLQSAELFDPQTNTFAATGSMVFARKRATATLLGSGDVLIAGGTATSSAAGELYDPATQTFRATSGPQPAPLQNHAATLMRDGNVLISGGDNSATTFLRYLPASEAFLAVAPIGYIAMHHTSSLLTSGAVMIAGSSFGSDGSKVQVFDPLFGPGSVGSIGEARYDHVATSLPNGNVVLIGGAPTVRALDSLTHVLVLDPPSGMPVSYLGAGATLLDGRVYYTGDTASPAYIYDPEPNLQTSRRPSVNAIGTRCQPTASFNVTGSAFSGGSEGSSGGWGGSAANAPLLRLRRVDNDDLSYVRPNGWSNTALNVSMDGLPTGMYRMSVVSNGIQSVEQMVAVAKTMSAPTLGAYPNVSTTNGTSTTNSPASAPVYFDPTSTMAVSVSAGFGGTISIDRSTGVVTISSAKPAGTYTITVTIGSYCSPVTTRSFTLTVTPIAAPAITATATSSTAVTITWPRVSGAARYDVYRRAAPGAPVLVATTENPPYVDTGRSANVAYLYQVKAVDFTGAASPFSNLDVATTTVFTDPTLTPHATLVKAVHVTQLRTAVNAVRAAAGLTAFPFTDAALVGVPVRSIHFEEMHTALDAARSTIGLPAMTWLTPVSAGSLVRAAAVNEIRDGVR